MSHVVDRGLSGRYRLDSLLGRGGMAEVWRGVDLRLDRPVAVKVLHATVAGAAVDRLDREARIVARLTHPNIVALYDAGADNGVPYLVMELVEGQSLARMLADGPLSDAGQVVHISDQVCEALAAAHAAGVVHQDITPSNILLTRAGVVKVCDFGVAQLPRAAGLSLHTPAAGTDGYIAPEQVAGGPVDGRADLYALGCVAYAMLTGGPPRGGSPTDGDMHDWVAAPAPVATLRADVPPELDRLVGRLLAPHPADRPATAAEVHHAFTRLAPVNADAAGVLDSGHARQSAVEAGAAASEPASDTVPAAHAGGQTRVLPVVAPNMLPPTGRWPPWHGKPGVAVIAAATAIAALVAYLLAAQIGGGESAEQAPPPTTASSPALQAAPPASTAAPLDVAGQVAAVQAAIDDHARAGTLEPDQAADLRGKLDELDRHLASGETDKAAEKAAEVADKLTEMHNDGKITTADYKALLPALQSLAQALPTGGDGDDD